VDFLDIGEILLSKLSSKEECSVNGTVTSSDGEKLEGSIGIIAHENRNSPGNASWGDSMRIETKVDNTGKFDIRRLSPGRFSLIHAIQGFSSRSQSSEITLAMNESLDLGTIALDRLLVANVSWIWSDSLPFKNQDAVQGSIQAEQVWYATSSEDTAGYRPSDLRCTVDQGKMYFECTHCPANFADLGTGEVSDFGSITLEQAKVKFGRTSFSNGHVYFVQQLHTKRYILMKVNSVVEIKPLATNASQEKIAKWVIESGGRIALHGRTEWIEDIKAIPTDDKLRISRISFFPPSKPDRRIFSKDLEALRSISDLEELNFRGQPIGDYGVKAISNLSKLKALNIHGCQISDAALEDIGKFRTLVNLDVGYSNNRISDASAEHLLNLKMLTVLNIYDSRITDKTLLSVLAKLPNLRSVELTATQVTSAGIEEFKRTKPECRVIKY